MSGYVVDYSLMDAEGAEIETACTSLLDAIKVCQRSAIALSSTDQLTGNTADNMKAYVSAYHVKVMEALINICHILKNRWKAYYSEYKSQVDASSQVFIPEEVILLSFKDSIEKCKRVSVALADDMVDCISEIGDLLDSDHGLKSAASGLDSAHGEASGYISELDGRINALEKSHASSDFVELNTLLDAINSTVGAFTGTLVTNRAASYGSSIPSVNLVCSDALSQLNKACSKYSVPNLRSISWEDLENKYRPEDENSDYYDVFRVLSGSEIRDKMWQLEMEQYHDPERFQQSILYSIAMGNTRELQSKIDVASTEGGTVFIPEGLFFFAPQATYKRSDEISYVIQLRSNVTIEGAGTQNTQLMPVANFREYCGTADQIQSQDRAIQACKDGFLQANPRGVDMFYFNDYEDGLAAGKSESECATFLRDAHFKGFTVDGRNACSAVHGRHYSSAGKGFMINLMHNCTWDSVNVKNTDGTGFGVDCPVNCSMTNCVASGCGKAADRIGHGGSGFGIGTGYSDNESISISNCTATGNNKFGFFFEHQARFKGANARTSAEDLAKTPYHASSTDTIMYRVSNCKAEDNLYNYGSLFGFNVEYTDCQSGYSTPDQQLDYSGQGTDGERRLMPRQEILEFLYEQYPDDKARAHIQVNGNPDFFGGNETTGEDLRSINCSYNGIQYGRSK